MTFHLYKVKERLTKPVQRIALQSSAASMEALRKSITQVFPEVTTIIENIEGVSGGGYKILVDDWLIDATLDTEVEILRKKVDAKLHDADDVKKIFRSELDAHEFDAEVSETGRVIEVKDGVATIVGLTRCLNQELLYIGTNRVPALALNLEKKRVGAVILGNAKALKEDDIVYRSEKVMEVGVSEKLLGRVIDPLGTTLDTGETLTYSDYRPIEKIAPGVIERKPVDVPLQTGIKAIDALIPIGRGQRELILGDRQTGKTTLAVDAILNQKGKNVICIYVAVGQKASKTAELVEKMRKFGGMDYTIVVTASAADPAPLLFLAPYTGVTLAEFFAEQGKDVLVVYDDLTKHAVAYREMSLLLRRPPGREAYPGDVFYLHSRLLERACRLSDERGGGSITALPIIETQAGDISAYIPTNVISITDGQIFLEGDLFFKGIRPAINVGLSVSRVGSAAQTKPMKKVAGSIKLALAQFRELEAFAQFSSDLDPATKQQIERGKRIIEVLKQPQYSPMSVADQVMSIYAVSKGFLDDVPVKEIYERVTEILEYVDQHNVELIEALEAGKWDEELEKNLAESITEAVTSEV